MLKTIWTEHPITTLAQQIKILAMMLSTRQKLIPVLKKITSLIEKCRDGRVRPGPCPGPRKPKPASDSSSKPAERPKPKPVKPKPENKPVADKPKVEKPPKKPETDRQRRNREAQALVQGMLANLSQSRHDSQGTKPTSKPKVEEKPKPVSKVESKPVEKPKPESKPEEKPKVESKPTPAPKPEAAKPTEKPAGVTGSDRSMVQDHQEKLQFGDASSKALATYFRTDHTDGGVSYDTFNANLRKSPDGAGLKGKEKELHDGLQEAFKTAGKLPKPVTVHRGIQLSADDKAKLLSSLENSIKTNTPITMKGMISTSFSEKVADSYGSDVTFRIKAKTGIIGDKWQQDKTGKKQQEMLQNHGTQYAVKKITEKTAELSALDLMLGKSPTKKVVYLEEI